MNLEILIFFGKLGKTELIHLIEILIIISSLTKGAVIWIWTRFYESVAKRHVFLPFCEYASKKAIKQKNALTHIL